MGSGCFQPSLTHPSTHPLPFSTLFKGGHLELASACSIALKPTPMPTPIPKHSAQFNVGHLELVSGAQDTIRAAGWDGVLLGGNYVAGARRYITWFERVEL